MERGLRWLIILGVLVFAVVGVAGAQSPAVVLDGGALLAGDSFADGPRSGVAFTERKTINGIKVPFASQPVGSISAVMRGWFSGTWAILTDKGFGDQPSSDFMLRIYLVEVDLRRANGGAGAVNILDWVTLSDPRKQIKGTITLATDKTRPLTGAEFNPISLARGTNSTLWVADAAGNSLLHFARDGALLEAPRTLSTGALLAMSAVPGGATLVLAVRNGDQVAIRTYDPAANKLADRALTYSLESSANTVSELTMLNSTQALILEQDRARGTSAKTKLVYLYDLSSGQKQLLADLMNINDAGNLVNTGVFGASKSLFGLTGPFRYPLDLSGVYPVDGTTLLIVNNNHFPFDTARANGLPDRTEFITVKLGNPLTLQLKDDQQ